jgi:hypothetical protein
MIAMDRWEHLHVRLDSFGVLGHPVSSEEQRDVDRRWLEAYCGNVKRATGEWIHLGYRWHAYSYSFERALVGDAARAAYQARAVTEFYAYFESDDLLFTCVSGPSPDMDDFGDELYLFPPSLAWTMVFTHEQGIGLGPYFAEPSVCVEELGR